MLNEYIQQYASQKFKNWVLKESEKSLGGLQGFGGSRDKFNT